MVCEKHKCETEIRLTVHGKTVEECPKCAEEKRQELLNIFGKSMRHIPSVRLSKKS